MAEVLGQETVIRVGAKTDEKALASSISYALYDNQKVKLRAIGAHAISKAVKGVILSRSFLSVRGVDLVIRPGFETVTFNDESGDTERSAVTLLVLPQ